MSAARPLERALQSILAKGRAPPGIPGPWQAVAEYALRPGKRLRPLLVGLGWAAASARKPPQGVHKFAAGLELLHAFLLVHDDIADGARTRRGGPALHCLLGPGKLGESLAVVAGDLLFVEAMDALLTCGLGTCHAAVREVLATCRDTAAGQYLDLAFAAAHPGEVPPEEARRCELLKTARYSFEAPLVAGALLAKARPPLVRALRAVARPLGLAFQLQDDLLPFSPGDGGGKDVLADLSGAKKTWMLALAWQALDDVGRARLQRCLRNPSPESLCELAGLLQRSGAMPRVKREIARLCRASRTAADRPELRRVRPELLAVISRIEAGA